jgi:Uma2 family endonuclease
MQKPQSPIVDLPVLESGDRLTRSEFERRYQAQPQLKKAELIEGVVYVASPVRVRSHSQPHSDILAWLGVYRALTPGTMVCDNSTIRLDTHNEPQPDALLRWETNQGGQSHISEDDYIEGAPELIVEIAASSASYDLHDKLQVYQRNGVQEYLVWLTQAQELQWYRLIAGEYQQQEPDQLGILRSSVFPGLWLAGSALLEGNMAEVLRVLQLGLESRLK